MGVASLVMVATCSSAAVFINVAIIATATTLVVGATLLEATDLIVDGAFCGRDLTRPQQFWCRKIISWCDRACGLGLFTCRDSLSCRPHFLSREGGICHYLLHNSNLVLVFWYLANINIRIFEGSLGRPCPLSCICLIVIRGDCDSHRCCHFGRVVQTH